MGRGRFWERLLSLCFLHVSGVHICGIKRVLKENDFGAGRGQRGDILLERIVYAVRKIYYGKVWIFYESCGYV